MRLSTLMTILVAWAIFASILVMCPPAIDKEADWRQARLDDQIPEEARRENIKRLSGRDFLSELEAVSRALEEQER